MKKPKTSASHHEFEQWNRAYDPRQAQVTPGYVDLTPTYRDARDAKLAGVGVRNQFPDEALGGVRSNIVSYTRGVHVGERLNPAAYSWPTEFNPETGLQYEARGERWTATDEDPVALNATVNEIPGSAVTQINPERQSILRKLLPTYHN